MTTTLSHNRLADLEGIVDRHLPRLHEMSKLLLLTDLLTYVGQREMDTIAKCQAIVERKLP